MLNFIVALDAETKQIQVLGHENLDQARGLVWIDIVDPTHADMGWIGKRFDFHPLALEDSLKSGQRPKVETYPHYVFLDVYAGRFNPHTRTIELTEVDIFLGEGYLITSHQEPVRVLETVRERWLTAASADGAGFLLYLLLDTIVDDYFPLVDHLEDQLEALEERLFDNFDNGVISQIFAIKKQLLLFRKVVAPTRDVVLMLARRETPLITAGTAVYLQDVYDHVIRVTDAIDTYRDLIGGTVEAYMSIVANRTNDTMKRLTTLSTILMSVTLIAGIYGMNFRAMPELEWAWGYGFALGLMGFVAGGLTLVFKRLKYF